MINFDVSEIDLCGNTYNDFLRASSIVQELKVVNDHTERGVALIREYTVGGLMTWNEQQLQFLLRIVHEHRKKLPESRKKTLKQ